LGIFALAFAAFIASLLAIALREVVRAGSVAYYALVLMPFCIIALVMYAAIRLVPLLPAAATGRTLSLRAAWRSTSGVGIKLVAAQFLGFAPVAVLINLLDIPAQGAEDTIVPFLILALQIAVFLWGTAVMAGFYSSLYAQSNGVELTRFVVPGRSAARGGTISLASRREPHD
jgi:hypothetical protein